MSTVAKLTSFTCIRKQQPNRSDADSCLEVIPPWFNDEDDDDGLQLTHTSSHDDPSEAYQHPWSCSDVSKAASSTSPLCLLTPPQTSASRRELRQHKRTPSERIKVITFQPTRVLPRLTYPDGTSAVVQRGLFRGHIDRRLTHCAYDNSGSLSHCAFRSCYCMTASLVPSPLKNTIDFDEVNPYDDENIPGYDDYYNASFGEKIRLMSWLKHRSHMEPPDALHSIHEGPGMWELFSKNGFDDTIPQTPLQQQSRFKRSLFHSNSFRRIVGHIVSVDTGPARLTPLTSSPSSLPILGGSARKSDGEAADSRLQRPQSAHFEVTVASTV